MEKLIQNGGKGMNIVVVGGDAAGLKTAARLRRLLPDSSITVLEKTDIVSYAGCGLPYFLSGDIDSFNELIETTWGEIKTPEYFKNSKGLDVITNCEVTRIDRREKCVYAQCADNKDKTYAYDYLVLAVGGKPLDLSKFVRGCDLEEVTNFTRPEEVKKLRQSLQKNEIGRVAIVGAGYIGLEVAEAFGALWGVEILLLEKEQHVMPANLDDEMATIVEDHLRNQDVDLRLGTTLQRIRKSEEGLIVTLDNGAEESVDRVILAPGVRPNTKLALDAGLKIGEKGGILVNNFGRTSDPAVYAAGDCAELPDANGTRIIPLGSIANRMGRVVANKIAGMDTSGIPKLWGTGVVKVFDINVASVGRSAKRLAIQGIECVEYWGSFPDKAHYYPENVDVKIKVTCEKNGRLAGLQVISRGEVVRWANAFAQILDLAEGEPEALMRFEHAYAPPFSTALDPLHNMGAMIENGDDMQINPMALLKGGEAGWHWINLLEEDEKQVSVMPEVWGTVQELTIPELRKEIKNLPKENVILVCARGPRSYEATRMLRHAGIDARYVAGGMGFLRS